MWQWPRRLFKWLRIAEPVWPRRHQPGSFFLPSKWSDIWRGASVHDGSGRRSQTYQRCSKWCVESSRVGGARGYWRRHFFTSRDYSPRPHERGSCGQPSTTTHTHARTLAHRLCPYASATVWLSTISKAQPCRVCNIPNWTSARDAKRAGMLCAPKKKQERTRKWCTTFPHIIIGSIYSPSLK
jgi:hypothetical protein